MILSPTGDNKSTILNILAAQDKLFNISTKLTN